MIRKPALTAAAPLGLAAGPLHAQDIGGVFGPVVNEWRHAYGGTEG